MPARLVRALLVAGLVGAASLASAGPAAAATTYRVSATVTVPDVAGLAVDPSLHTVYLPQPFDTRLSTLDTRTNTTTDRLDGVRLSSPAVDPVGHLVYFRGGPGIEVYDETANAITRTIPVQVAVDDFALDSTAGDLFVVSSGDHLVTEIDANTGDVIGTVDGAINPVAVAVDPTTHRAYVADEDGHQVLVIDGATGTLVDTIDLNGADPEHLALDAPAHTLYAGGSDATLAVIDTRDDSLTTQLQTSDSVTALAVDATAHAVYAAEANSNSVVIVDGATRRVAATLTVGAGPDAIGVDPTTHTAYVVNGNDETLSVITSSTGVGTTPQTITFTSTPPARPATGDTYVVTATGGGSGNPVQLSATSASAGVCTVDDHGDDSATVTFTGLGTCVVAAHQDGDDTYAPAKLARQQIRVRGDQTITFTSTPPSPANPGGSYQATATGGGSGNPVTFAATTRDDGVCTVSASGLVGFIGTGTCVVIAHQAGSAQYRPAARAQQRITVRSA